MRTIFNARTRFYVSRFLLGFILTATIFYVFFASPEQKAEHAIRNYRSEVKNSLLALQKSYDRISALEDPAVIKPQEPKQAWSYAVSSNDVLDSIRPKVPKTPKISTNISQNYSINKFNRVVNEPDYQRVLVQTAQTLKSDQAFLDHHTAIMKSLINVLQYDPRVDLASSDRTILNQHLEAASDGLATTMERLNQAPYYSDPSLDRLKNIVLSLQKNRDEMAAKLSQTGKLNDDQKQGFYTDVESAQQQLLQNRSAWWKEHRLLVLITTDETEKQLAKYVSRLESIYN